MNLSRLMEMVDLMIWIWGYLVWILWLVGEVLEPGIFEAPEACVEAWREICNVVKGVWEKQGAGEITVDSAAEESVCPEDWERGFGLKAVEKGREMKFRNASGGKMNHYGSRAATFRTDDGKGRMMGMDFQVSDVRKPLAAV